MQKPKESNVQRLKRENRELRSEQSRQQLAAGELSASPRNFTTQINAEKPAAASLSTVFARCRYWQRESLLLKMYLALHSSVANYGLMIRAEDKKDQEKIDKWLLEELAPASDSVSVDNGETVEVESNSSIRESVEKFVRSCWTEKSSFSNVVTAWTDGQQQPVILNIESCDYTDTFGIELLRYTHGLSQAQVASLPDELKKAFSKPVIYVNPKIGMHFKVWKPSGVGSGFSTPELYSIFRLLGEIESKEFGQNALAFGCRSVKRAHLLGHEIKGGTASGQNRHFWKKERSDAVKRAWVDVEGFEDYTCNFDEDIKYWLPDPKLFDETMWQGSDRRFTTWGGSLLKVFASGTANSYLVNLLKAEITEERRVFGQFLGWVINKSYAPPAPIKVAWSNAIFSEPRLAAEMLKFAKQYGNVSSRTFIEEIGQSPEIERERKLAEVADTDAHELEMPSFDAAHGTAPALDWKEIAAAAAQKASGEPAAGKKGAAAGATPGRKPGSPNAKTNA